MVESMKILIAYESSGVMRRAFAARGHDVWSCDLLWSEDASPRHIVGDVRDLLDVDWDMVIAHPPCTYLTVSAAWAFGDGPYHQKVKLETLVGERRREARDAALANFRMLLDLPCRVAVENPAPSFVSRAIRPPDQTIQPYEYGDDASKRTGLWLKNLPLLQPTQRIAGRIVTRPDGSTVERWSNQTDSGQNKLSPGENRWRLRSRTFAGIANACAEQWG